MSRRAPGTAGSGAPRPSAPGRLLLALGAGLLVPAALAAQQDPAALPLCEAGTEAGDCALPTETGYLTFAYGDDGTVTVTQTDTDGLRKGAPILLEAAGGAAAPVLKDLSGDERPEVLVPVASGGPNVTYAVLARDGMGAYLPAGEIAAMGADGIEIGPEGTIRSVTRDGAAALSESADVWTVDGLERVYTLTVDLEARRCTLDEDARPEMLGESAASVVARCEEREWP